MICDRCAAEEGQLHQIGCWREKCPFCGDYWVICDCIYDKLGLRDPEKYQEKHAYLSRKVYREGPDRGAMEAWWKLMTKQGRVPFTPSDIPVNKDAPRE